MAPLFLYVAWGGEKKYLHILYLMCMFAFVQWYVITVQLADIKEDKY